MANVSFGVKQAAEENRKCGFGKQERWFAKSCFTFANGQALSRAIFLVRHKTMDNSIDLLVSNFVKQIEATVETAAARRVQAVVAAALGSGAAPLLPRRRGRPPKTYSLAPAPVAAASGKRRPKQICPVPGCPGLAAPVFGMVCSAHRGVSKTLIKKYRAQRKAAKAKV